MKNRLDINQPALRLQSNWIHSWFGVLNDVDRQDFLQTLAEACQKAGFQVHAYCLMRNHFHLVEHHSGELKRESAEA